MSELLHLAAAELNWVRPRCQHNYAGLQPWYASANTIMAISEQPGCTRPSGVTQRLLVAHLPTAYAALLHSFPITLAAKGDEGSQCSLAGSAVTVCAMCPFSCAVYAQGGAALALPDI